LGACTVNHEIKPVLERKPLVESLPLTVGIYFSPEFRTYHRSQCGLLFCNEYELGPPSVALFEILVAGLFDKVLAIETMPPTRSKLDVAGILAPTITRFDIRYLEITYRMTLYSPAGSELGAWEVDGAPSGETLFPAEPTRMAMRRAAARFVKEFRTEPVVMHWLEEAGVKVSAPTSAQNTEGAPP
jgi:hypothetical protein